MNALKRALSVFLALTVFVSIPINSYAVKNNIDTIHPDSDINHINLNVDDETKVYTQDYSDDSNIKPYGPIIEYVWEITSKEIYRKTFGEWRDGPTGEGPGSVSINDSNIIDRNFTATINGEYPMGTGKIGLSLGVDIGKSKSYGTEYTITLDKDEIKTITFRPKINVYKVVQTYYKVNSYTGEKTALDKKTAYVDVFNNWDYSWRYGY
ncbi:hypothetical protein [Tissierella praeacuta]|uniref:hypothetical protein n=1 Tax=Tissierella praeacuta TaxID=43131 RepID=UPI00289E39DA|nr:hypothetical protein [Tissierella praeacuta]